MRATAVDDGADPLRDRLLDAAAAVFARQGYEGTRIKDIVAEAGLSTGAVYGRFSSKHELLEEAVISRSTSRMRGLGDDVGRVADLLTRIGSSTRPGISDGEALLLETFVTARRHDEVAASLADADRRWRLEVAPLVDAAVADRTIAAGVDPDAVLFLVRVLRLGLLLHRGSGLPGPDQAAWGDLVARVVASFGGPAPTGHAAADVNNRETP